MTGRRLAALVALVATLPALAGGAAADDSAYQRPGVTYRASSTPAGEPGDGSSGGSEGTAVSADGRYVAFHSNARNLHPGKDNATYGIFVWDRDTGELELVSVSSDGTPGNRSSFRPALSADGRYVAFDSRATNFDERMPSPPNDFAIFRHDRLTGETILVSVAYDGGAISTRAQEASISADGRHVAYASRATNLVSSPPVSGTRPQVYVTDVETGATELASVSSDGAAANGSAFRPEISADGQHVAFHALSTNLAPGTSGNRYDIFVHDRQTKATEVVSVDADGTPRGGTAPSISANGRYVAFGSINGGHVPAWGGASWHVFVHDRARGVTEQASVRSDGTQARGHNANPSISADGRYVAFFSQWSGIAERINPDVAEIVVHDRLSGVSELVSVSTDGTQSDGHSYNPVISGDGRIVVWDSVADSLAPGGSGGTEQTYVRDRGPQVGTVGPVHVERDGGDATVSGLATFSPAVISTAARDSSALDPLLEPADAALHAAHLLYRPERADLFVRLELERMRQFPLGMLGPAGRVYGLELTAGGDRYQVRATAVTSSEVALYRCDLLCEQVADLGGSVGARGTEVAAALPLALLGIGEGDTLAGLRAFVSAGDTDLPGADLADLALPDATVPQRSVTVHLQAGGATSQTAAELDAGTFTAILDAGNLPAGPLTARVDVCLGQACTATEAQE